jgi:hypothetical protein
MSKSALKKELQSFTKEQLIEQFLALHDAYESMKGDYEHYLLAQEENELTEEERERDDYDYKEKLTPKYRDIVRRIADGLSANCICYFNPDTLEMEEVFKDLLDEILFEDEEEEDDGEDNDDEKSSENELGFTFMKWKKCVIINPLESNESYKIMEKFVNQLKPGRETDRLQQAVFGYKPFANFNHQIHNSKYREDWFAFRQKELEKFVIDNYFHEYLER